MTANPFAVTKCKIISITPQTLNDYTYRIACDISPKFGQFIVASIPTVGEAPFSISDFRAGSIDITVRFIGKVTNHIKRLRTGDDLYIRGPYGNGFPVERFSGKHLVIVTGGSGLVPVKGFIGFYEKNTEKIHKMDILMGFKSPGDMLFAEEAQGWSENEKINTLVTIYKQNAAWVGRVGFVTNLISEIEIEDYENTEAIVIGSQSTLKTACNELAKHRIKDESIWVSLERKMSCGVGICGNCRVNDIHVCADGPVFSYSAAKKFID